MKHEEILLYVISLMRIFPLEFNEKMKSKAGTTGILGGVDILLTDRVGPHPMDLSVFM